MLETFGGTAHYIWLGSVSEISLIFSRCRNTLLEVDCNLTNVCALHLLFEEKEEWLLFAVGWLTEGLESDARVSQPLVFRVVVNRSRVSAVTRRYLPLCISAERLGVVWSFIIASPIYVLSLGYLLPKCGQFATYMNMLYLCNFLLSSS